MKCTAAVPSGNTMRSTELFEMSRSCHRTVFSRPVVA
jgi:hypothetical protein